jgi:hypothetical protein
MTQKSETAHQRYIRLQQEALHQILTNDTRAYTRRFLAVVVPVLVLLLIGMMVAVSRLPVPTF